MMAMENPVLVQYKWLRQRLKELENSKTFWDTEYQEKSEEVFKQRAVLVQEAIELYEKQLDRYSSANGEVYYLALADKAGRALRGNCTKKEEIDFADEVNAALILLSQYKKKEKEVLELSLKTGELLDAEFTLNQFPKENPDFFDLVRPSVTIECLVEGQEAPSCNPQ